MLGSIVKAHCGMLVIQNKVSEREREKVLQNVETWIGTLKRGEQIHCLI